MKLGSDGKEEELGEICTDEVALFAIMGWSLTDGSDDSMENKGDVFMVNIENHRHYDLRDEFIIVLLKVISI
jgi:hypothetical protein